MHSALGKMMESDYAFPRAPPRSLSLFFSFYHAQDIIFLYKGTRIVFHIRAQDMFET
jgi:hypothetical protein